MSINIEVPSISPPYIIHLSLYTIHMYLFNHPSIGAHMYSNENKEKFFYLFIIEIRCLLNNSIDTFLLVFYFFDCSKLLSLFSRNFFKISPARPIGHELSQLGTDSSQFQSMPNRTRQCRFRGWMQGRIQV